MPGRDQNFKRAVYKVIDGFKHKNDIQENEEMFVIIMVNHD